MRFSPHYYVLCLGTTTTALFEAFRDSLIDVENQGFPVSGPKTEPDAVNQAHRFDLARRVDEFFDRYHGREPLRLVVVGEPEMQFAFDSVTVHGAAIVGRIEGDHTATSVRDLGQIVWPVVKEAMSGVLDRAMRDLADCSGRGHVTSGLEAVVRAASRETQATLLVEDGYHRKGSVSRTNGAPVITPEVDVRDAMDDVVDAVIEEVLEAAGTVVFMPHGSLLDQDRIVLLPGGARGSGRVPRLEGGSRQ